MSHDASEGLKDIFDSHGPQRIDLRSWSKLEVLFCRGWVTFPWSARKNRVLPWQPLSNNHDSI
jgi:hypothetical protein